MFHSCKRCRSANPAPGDRACEVHRGRRVGVRADEPPRIRSARRRRRLQRVHHVAAVGGQTGGVGVRAARLRVLAGDAPDLDDGHRRAVGQHDRHLQQRANRPPQVRLRVVDEGLGAITTLQQERLPAGDVAEPRLQPVHLGRHGDRGHALEQRSHARDVVEIRPRRLLRRRSSHRVVERRRQRRGQRGKLRKLGDGHIDGPSHAGNARTAQPPTRRALPRRAQISRTSPVSKPSTGSCG